MRPLLTSFSLTTRPGVVGRSKHMIYFMPDTLIHSACTLVAAEATLATASDILQLSQPGPRILMFIISVALK